MYLLSEEKLVMWIKFPDYHLQDGLLLRYSLDGDDGLPQNIIDINKLESRDPVSKRWIKTYKATIYVKDFDYSYPYRHRYNVLFEIDYADDLDILKLKSLIKAKEMGWHIENLNV